MSLIRTFGIGLRSQKKAFLAVWEWDFRPKTSVNPRGIVKTMPWENGRFRTFLGSMDGHTIRAEMITEMRGADYYFSN